MLGLISSIAGAGLNFIGQERTNEANMHMAREANVNTRAMAGESMAFTGEQNSIARAFNAEEAQKNRDFQEQMSNTAFQRAKQDMLAAGINPMLAGMNQSGASAPSGSAASSGAGSGTSGTATAGNRAENSIGAAINSAIAIRSLMAEIGAKDSQNELNHAAAKNATAQAITHSANARQATANAKATEAQLDAIASESKNKKLRSDYDRDFIKADSWLNRASSAAPAVNSGMNVLNFLNPLPKVPKGKGLWDLKTGEIHFPKKD